MSDHLSEEVVAEILKRLSVKSLLKCTSVCKSWYSLISNPSFISLHIAHTTQVNKLYFLVKKNLTYPMKPHFVLHSDNESFSEFKQLGDYGNDVDVAEFITTSLREHCNGTIFFTGFGFDSKNNAYKVVRIAYIGKVFKPFGIIQVPFVEIFELSSNAWRIITVKNLNYVLYDTDSFAYLNGAVHWVAQIYGGVGRKMMIASFDLSSEIFEELTLPHALVDSSDPSVTLSVYHQSLALIHYEEPIFYDESCMSFTKCCIWVMKEYGAAESWTKLFNINLPNPGGLMRVLSFQHHGGILIEDGNSEIASYDPKTQRVTPLCFHGYIFEVHSYMESLLLLKNRTAKLTSVYLFEGVCEMTAMRLLVVSQLKNLLSMALVLILAGMSNLNEQLKEMTVLDALVLSEILYSFTVYGGSLATYIIEI
ncbi:F-box protein CPR1-like [Mercurialis annua]|uniref:F-box protein CPR1-like n=1 Tax=Mercurialis annua TaxID=3986 RepID=UPI002160B6C0|nr:F-box protein CPR1-like [Mercurialis annua]